MRGRWYFGLISLYELPGWHRDGLAISARGILLWLTAATVPAYIAAAAAVFWVWQANPYSALTYADAFFYPLRQEEIAVKKGQAFIAQATDMIRAGKYHDGANLLRLGLERYPGDVRGRLLLAQYHFLTNQRPMGLRVMSAGLTEKFPGRPYLEDLFARWEEGEDFAQVALVCERYLRPLSAGTDGGTRVWLTEQRFKALAALGRWKEVMALADAEPLAASASEHRVLALLAQNRPTDALAFLDEWRTQRRYGVAMASRLRIRALREADRLEEMDAAVAELADSSRADPDALAFAIGQQALVGRAASTLEDYLYRFGGTAENLQRVAEVLAGAGDLPLLQRTAMVAAEHGFPPRPFRILIVLSHLQRGEWDSAVSGLTDVPIENGRNADIQRIESEWLRQLIEAARTSTESVQRGFVEFLRNRPWRIRIFRTSVDALVRGGNLGTASEVIDMGLKMFPASNWLRDRSAELKAEIASRAVASTHVAIAAETTLGERPFFTRLGELLHAGEWDQAELHLQQMHRAMPVPQWLVAREADVQLAQVRIAHGQRDERAMQLAARTYLNATNERSQELLDVAREFFNAGDKAAALVLTREILARTPYPPARRQLAEWQPPNKQESAAVPALASPRNQGRATTALED